MPDYTPTTPQVRDFWVSHGTRMPAAKAYTEQECAAEFDRWLADHDKEVAAHAWDVALEAVAWATAEGPTPIEYVAAHNPYRSGSEGDTHDTIG